jgi:hypothetical protein
VRLQSALALKAIGPSARAAVPDLVIALDDEWRAVGVAAAGALLKIGAEYERAVAALNTIVGDDSQYGWVRTEAAEELGDLGRSAAPAVPALIRAVESGVPDLRDAAIDALGRIGPAASEAVPALQRLLDQPPRGLDVGRVVVALSSIRR